jgi:tetratricopeptide (TPR) repeat protein
LSLHRIEVTPFAALLCDIVTGRRSGTLTVIREPVRKVTWWVDGELVLVSSNSLHDSIGSYLFRRRLINDIQALQMTPEDWADSVRLIHETDAPLRNKDALLREWATGLALPLFSFTDGSAIFEDQPPLAPDKRIPIRSMPAFVLEGVRSIRDGLVLRRSLGDLRRKVQPARAPLYDVQSLPLTGDERAVTVALREEEVLEAFLKRLSGDVTTVARMVILMLALGSIVPASESRPEVSAADADQDPQRDLMLLAAIGAEDPRSLKVVALSRQLPMMTHYELLRIPLRATRTEVMQRTMELKKRFDPLSFPPIVRGYVEGVRRRIEEAGAVLQDPVRRSEYDALIKRTDATQLQYSVQQRVARKENAERNYRKAMELSTRGDYYGAIVMLRQAVEFAPDHVDAWVLLGNCQQRNPKWSRDAIDSFGRALAIDPNNIEALLSLGDLYNSMGLTSRAESSWQDVLQIDPENMQALKRLQTKTRKPVRPVKPEASEED